MSDLTVPSFDTSILSAFTLPSFDPAPQPAPVPVDDYMDYGVGQLPLDLVALAPPVVVVPAPVVELPQPVLPVETPVVAAPAPAPVDEYMDYGVGQMPVDLGSPAPVVSEPAPLFVGPMPEPTPVTADPPELAAGPVPQVATGVGEIAIDVTPPADDYMDYGVGQVPLETIEAAAPPPSPAAAPAEAGTVEPVSAPATPAPPPVLTADDWASYGQTMTAPPATVSAPAETDGDEPTEAVTSPVAPQPEIESRPLAPLPPEKQTVVVKPGDAITKIVGNDVAAIGDFAIKNNLRNSTIIAGREYDATPIDRANLSPAEIKTREQIGQAFLNADNARLAQLAAIAQQQQAQREAALFGRQALASQSNTGWMTGPAEQGSFAAGAEVQQSIFGTNVPALPSRFLTEKATNPVAPFAHSSGVILGRSAFNLFGYDVNTPSTVRSAGEMGYGTGVTTYNAGDVSVLGINNYSVTSINRWALAGSATARVTEGPTQGLTGSFEANTKAQSLLTDTMFETLPNGVGKPNESLRAEIAAKYLVQALPIAETRTDGIYAGIEKRTVTAALGSATAGVGGSFEVAIPFSESRKMGAEGSIIVDLNLGESKQMSAAGSVADPSQGIYGASFGFETRNRLASGSVTLNGGADIGLLRGKTTGQVFVSAGAFGGGGTASWAWNDNEGSLTLQATASLLAGIGGGFDLSGKYQADWAKGLVGKITGNPPPKP